MSVVILGWGSLIWDPRGLAEHIVGADRGEAAWVPNGPVLPIEFSRVSGDHDERYLSLVVDADDGVAVRTRVATSTRRTVQETVEDLRRRERTKLGHIGFVEPQTGLSHARMRSVVEVLTAWAAGNHVEAVVWTDLPPNFRDRVGERFSPDSALAFLQRLAIGAAHRAREYMRRAPPEVDTPVRRRAVESGWLAG
jgi:hypothetical protein